jgi:hypothetical protein
MAALAEILKRIGNAGWRGNKCWQIFLPAYFKAENALVSIC